MNCFSCKLNFDGKIKIPKILINCGHSFCINCLEKKKELVGDSFVKIKCFICSVETLTETLDNLPINMAILENREKKDHQKHILCSVHSKEIEAFCDDDKSMLCVNCIIENSHKNHNFSSIDKAAQKEKSSFLIKCDSILSVELKINEIIEQNQVYIEKMKEKAINNIKTISFFFSYIKNMIEERENELKRRINEKMNNEEDKINLVNNKLNSQICSILHFKKEKDNVENLSGFEFLLKMSDFYSELNSIDLVLPQTTRDTNFQEMNQEEEISYIKSILNDLSTEKETCHLIKSQNISLPTSRCSSIINEYNKETKILLKLDKSKIPYNSIKDSTQVVSKDINRNVETPNNIPLTLTSNNVKESSTSQKKDKVLIKTDNKTPNKKFDLEISEFKLTDNRNDQKKIKKTLERYNTLTTSNIVPMKDIDNISSEDSFGVVKDPTKRNIDMNVTSPIKNVNESIMDISIINKQNINDQSALESSKFTVRNTSPQKSLTNDLASLYKTFSSFILIFGGKPDFTTRKLDIETKRWTETKKVTVERTDFGGVQYKENKILIVGGRVNNQSGSNSVTDSILMVNTDNLTTKTLDVKLKVQRSNFGCIYYTSKLFIIGGFNGKDYITNFEVYDKESKVWIDLPKMLSKRKEFATVINININKNIYILGGTDDKDAVLKAVEKFDIEKNVWVRIENMIHARKNLAALTMPDGIYVFGGYDGNLYLKSVEKYDFQTRKWKLLADMIYPKSMSTCVCSNDCQFIFTLGGFDGKPMNVIEKYIKNKYRYDIIKNKWEIFMKMPSSKYKHQSFYLVENK